MKKIYLILFAFVCITAKAQWKYANFPAGGDVGSIASTANTVFASFGGDLYRTTDKGANWSFTTVKSVFDIVVHNNKVIVFSYENGLLASTDEGNTWEPAGNGIPDSVKITALASDGVTLLAEGYEDAVFKSVDNGLTWRNVYVGDASLFISDGQHLSIQDKLAAVSTKNGVFTSTDAGETWVESPTNMPPFPTSALTIFGNKIIALFGNEGYVTADSGKTWNEVVSDLPWLAIATDIAYADSALYLATEIGFYVSTDGGETWVERFNGLPAESFVNAVNISNHGIYTGTTQNIFFSADKGLNWESKNKSVNKVNVRAVTSSGDRIFTGSLSGVLASGNNSATWVPKMDGLPRGSYVSHLAATDSVIMYGREQNIYASTDKGESWTELESGLPPNPYISSLKENNGTFYAAMSFMGLFASSDKGQNWTSIVGDLPGNSVIFNIGFHNSRLFIDVYNDGIYTSTNGGDNWVSAINGIPKDIWGMDFCAVGDAVFYSTDKGLYKTVDDGQNWALVPGIPEEYILGLTAFGNTLLLSTEKDVFLSHDKGNNWISIKDGLPETNVNQFMLKGNTIYAATANGLWYRALSDVTGISNHHETARINIYPNPGNGLITVASATNLSHIDVFNLLGECVYARNVDALTLQLDLSHLGKGMYSLNIRTEDKLHLNKKIVIQ